MIDYDEDWLLSLLCQREGSVVLRGSMWAWPAALFAVLFIYLDEWQPSFREDFGILDVSKSQLWAATTGCVAMMLGFRTKQAWGRFWEGTGLLHQMRGEWFDTVSNCVTFSIAAKPSKPKQVNEFRHAIIRLMSACHASALEEIADNNIRLESIDTFGLNDATLSHLQDCHQNYKFNRVEVMLHLLQSLITKALDDGVLKIPPPICSRVYQTISRGFVNLLNSKKIQDTKFAFPYAQMITVLLLVLQVIIPMQMSVMMRSKVLAAFFSFLPLWCFFCLNFIAQELENPFGTDTNDLPLVHFQTEMNNCLMMLLHPNTDLIAGVSSRCEMDFFKLQTQIRMSHAPQDEAEELHRSATRQKTRRLSEFDISGVESVEPRGSISSVISAKEDSIALGSQAGSPPLAVAPAPAAQPAAKKAEEVPANLEVEVGNEPGQEDRKGPRMASPQMGMMGRPPNTNGCEAAPGASSDMARIADLQPVLAKNMDELIKSLQAWTENVEAQVEGLTRNSDSLKGALRKFGDGLPSMTLTQPVAGKAPAAG